MRNPTSTHATLDARSVEGADARAILEALARIERRLDRLERIGTDAVRGGEGAIGAITDTVDRWIAGAQARGIDVDDRARRLLRLAERTTEPTTLDALERVLGLAEQAPGAIAMITDSLDQAIGRAREGGVDLDERLRNLLHAADRLTRGDTIAMLDAMLARADAIRALVVSGMLDPSSVAIVSLAGRALAEAAADPSERIGAIGMMRALSDADVRSATGFLVRFARRLGRSMGPSRAPQLPAGPATDDTER